MPSEAFDRMAAVLALRRNRADIPLTELRAHMESVARGYRLPAGVRREQASFAGVPGVWCIPEGVECGRTVLYLHGGGFVLGSARTHLDLGARLALASGARLFLAEYRLAPEHPFPAAIDDAQRVYEALLAERRDAGQLIVAGDSAGGGLVVSLLLRLVQANRILPAAGVCLSPWVDLGLGGASLLRHAALDPLAEPALMAKLAEAYLASEPAESPLASPIHADLRGLPPLLIQVGSHEGLLDDATRLAERARRAGVDVTLRVWDSMIHGWQLFAAMVPEARAALEEAGAFIRQKTTD